MFNVIGLWMGGAIVGVILKDYLPRWWGSLMVRFRSDVKDKAVHYLKDPEWKAIVAQIVLKVQKEAGSDASLAKLRKATAYIKAIIPTNLDDAIIDAMVDLVIAEVKKPIVL